MALLIGQPIDARQLEQAISVWPPERFVSMCNDLAWAVSGRHSPSVPSFTRQINAKDGGIDAEWWIEIPDGEPLPTPVLNPGWNIFQFKKRDLGARDRASIISGLKSEFKGALSELDRKPDCYSVFVNIDLKHDDKSAFKKALLEGYTPSTEVNIDIVGAAELASWLNSHPHLRASYFIGSAIESAFKTWEGAFEAHRSQKQYSSGDLDLIGRADEIKRLRALVDDPRVRIIILSGPHDMGKSRLMLEGTKHLRPQVVFAVDPRSMQSSDYSYFCSTHGEVLCVVEDPDRDALEPLIREVVTLPGLKLAVTLPTAEAPAFSYGLDERLQRLHLKSLEEPDARELLKATGQSLDLEAADWIISRAGGIPGVLLAASSVGEKIRQTNFDLAELIGREFNSCLD